MAITKITDVVVPEIYDQYAAENGIYTNSLYKSGIVVRQPNFDALLDGGAKQFEMPFWKTNDMFSVASHAILEGEEVTNNKIQATKMTARRQFRDASFGWTDVAAMLAGSSPEMVLASNLDAYWNKSWNTSLFASVRGVIADNVANDSGDMVLDITSDADKYVSAEAIIKAQYKHGDMTGGFVGIAMHSLVKMRLEQMGLIDVVPESQQNPRFETYAGMTVFTDDTLVSGSDYYTIIFKSGAFGFGYSANGYLPTEIDRDPKTSGGEDFLYTRRAYVLHPYGFSYSDDAGATQDFPLDTELATAANWDRNVASVKNTRFVALLSQG